MRSRDKRLAGAAGAAALALAIVVAAGAAPAPGSPAAKQPRAQVAQLSIAEFPVEKGQKIGIEVAARYRLAGSGADASAFVHRFLARAKAELGARSFAANPGGDARIVERVTTDRARVKIRAHLFFSRAESRAIRRARKEGAVDFVGAVTYSVDRDGDGTPDASFGDRREDATPRVVTPGGADVGSQDLDPCQHSTDSTCVNTPSNAVKAPHFWATETLKPDCPSGLKVVEVEDDEVDPDYYPYGIRTDPSDKDHFTVDTVAAPTLYVTDDNLSGHPVTYVAVYGCSVTGD